MTDFSANINIKRFESVQCLLLIIFLKNMVFFRKLIAAAVKQSPKLVVRTSSGARQLHHVSLRNISPEELDDKFERYFNRCDIDGWDLRQGMNDINGLDAVPEPRVIIAALYACRRVNDYALAIRLLETVKNKCGPHVSTIYPYIIQEIAPVLCELGVDTPESLGYHKPEMYVENVDHMH